MDGNEANYLVPIYLAYTACAVGLTIWLARSLFRDGAVFLAEVFDTPEIGAAVNRLLVTGFYMLNLGYAFAILKSNKATTTTDAFEVLASKLGILLLSLALIHFVNLFVFTRIRHRRELTSLEPPVAPQRWVAPPPMAGQAMPTQPPHVAR
jgi:hypothetical protein